MRFTFDFVSLHLSHAQRPRCAAGAVLWLREPTGACLLAVGTNALLGSQIERRKGNREARAALAEATARWRETASNDATLREMLLISGNEATASCFTETTAIECISDRSDDATVKMQRCDDAGNSESGWAKPPSDNT